jgi:hypothetical protein
MRKVVEVEVAAVVERQANASLQRLEIPRDSAATISPSGTVMPRRCNVSIFMSDVLVARSWRVHVHRMLVSTGTAAAHHRDCLVTLVRDDAVEVGARSRMSVPSTPSSRCPRCRAVSMDAILLATITDAGMCSFSSATESSVHCELVSRASGSARALGAPGEERHGDDDRPSVSAPAP